MITAELRSSLALAPAAETSAMPSLEAFDHVQPLPMWRDIVRGDLRYRCPVARLLAAQNHLDGNLLASHWQALLLSSQEKMGRDSVKPQPLKSSEGPYSFALGAFSLVEETQLEQEGSLLSWTLRERGLRRWLAVGASSTAWESHSAAKYSPLYGSKPLVKQRTVEREFNWQYSYSSSDRLLRLLQEAGQALANSHLVWDGRESFGSCLERDLQASSLLRQPGLSPLVLAQVSLVDAMAVAPRRLIPAVDQLSHAWESWLSIQVLNDLRLSQMAEVRPLADVVCLTSKLLSLSIQIVFGMDPVEQL